MKKRATHKYLTYNGLKGRTTMTWGTHLGETLVVCKMKDTHIANIIDMLKQRKTFQNDARKRGHKSLLKFFLQEAKYRGLSKAFLAKAPYPYFDKEGREWIWVHSVGKPLPVGGNKEMVELLYEK